MQLEAQIALLALVMLIPVVGLVLMKKRQRVNVLGIDPDADPERGRWQKCKILKGAAIWKRPGQKPLALVLAPGWSYGDAFIANVSESEGRIIRLKSTDGDNLGMPGSRAWCFVASLGLGQVSNSQGTDLTKVLMVGFAVIGVFALGALGAALYVVKMLQDSGVA